MSREKLRSRTRRCKQARLNELVRAVDELDTILTRLPEGSDGALEGIAKEDMQRVRDLVTKVGQCFHEYNAYRNAEEIFVPAPSKSTVVLP